MLVRHNLSPTNASEWLNTLWGSSGKYEYKITGKSLKFRNIKDNTNAIAYGIDFKSNKEPYYSYLEVENIGAYDVQTLVYNLDKNIYRTIKPGEIVILKAEHTKNRCSFYVIPTDNAQEWHEIKINKMMITDEPTDTYLPPNKDLPQDKIPPQGEYTEIYPI